FPFWAVSEAAMQDKPDNSSNCSNWPTRTLFDRDLEEAWRAFYGNANDVRKRFIVAVQSVAVHFVNVPGVIGYDLLNEPMGDEESELSGLYEEEGRAIRAVDPQAILFVSPRA